MTIYKTAAADMYNTDLERHMFSLSRRPRRRRRSPLIDRIGDWLRDWFRDAWTRRRRLARAAS